MSTTTTGRNHKSSATATTGSSSSLKEGSKKIQDFMHELISRLSVTSEHMKSWPEATGDDPSIHVECTSKLIVHIRQVIDMLQRIENLLKQDEMLKQSYNKCLIPLDLLDLLDANNLNPDCFCRGLLREAMGQLTGLKRRKRALALLGTAIETGLQERKMASTLSSSSITTTRAAATTTTPAMDQEHNTIAFTNSSASNSGIGGHENDAMMGTHPPNHDNDPSGWDNSDIPLPPMKKANNNN